MYYMQASKIWSLRIQSSVHVMIMFIYVIINAVHPHRCKIRVLKLYSLHTVDIAATKMTLLMIYMYNCYVALKSFLHVHKF